jgi:hypothetical protein
LISWVNIVFTGKSALIHLTSLFINVHVYLSHPLSEGGMSSYEAADRVPAALVHSDPVLDVWCVLSNILG